MTPKDEALVKIAVDALQAVRRGITKSRHYDLWGLAISRVRQTQRDVDADQEIEILRVPR